MRSSHWVEPYVHLVHRIARSVSGNSRYKVEFDDLVQAGFVGLLESRSRFVSEKEGAPFAHFASKRIRGAMIDEIRRVAPLARGDFEFYVRSKEAEQELLAQGTATSREIAERLEMPLEKYQALRLRVQRQISPPVRFGYEAISEEDSPEHCIELEMLRRCVDCAVYQLSDHEKSAYSLYEYRSFNLKQIGSVLGVSESRASQLKSAAKRKLLSAITTRMGASNE